MELVVAVLIAIMIYTVQKRLYARNWSKNLDVDIHFTDEYIRTGESSTLVEVINNAKSLPLPVFHVKFSTSRSFRFQDNENVSVTDGYHRNDVFSVMGNKKITRRLDFTATERGLYGVSSINVIARDFFMSTSFAKGLKNDTWIYVLPKRLQDLELFTVLNHVLGDYETRLSLMEDPFSFRGIRDYNHGDLMRRVNWKASAKTGDLKVNVYQHTAEQKIKILLNFETNSMIKTDYLHERAIEVASTATDYFIQNKIPVMICSNGIDIITGQCEQVLSGASFDHGIMVDKYLARIKEDAGLDTFMRMIDRELQCPDTTVSYLVISGYYKEDLLRKLDYLKQQGCRVQMIVPYYDVQDTSTWRDYMYGWEVKLDEI